MKILGITGGVGSGKSRILHILETKYHAFIVEADKLAHQLMKPGESAYERIVSYFGETILDPEGNIDRKKLGGIVFQDSEKLSVLNSVTHPAVKEEIKRLIGEKEKENTTRFFVIEAALLIQDGYREICDEIWYIQVSQAERIKRLMKQRNYSVEQCISIFQSQPEDSYYENGADRVIDNNVDFESVERKLEEILSEI